MRTYTSTAPGPRVRQETSKGAGFAGMDPIIERTVFDPDDGHFLFWKPGGAALRRTRRHVVAARSGQRSGAERSRTDLRKTGTGATGHRPLFHRIRPPPSSYRCCCNWSTTARSTSRREIAIFWSRTISVCRWTWTCSPYIRTRIISATLMEGYATLPAGSANG